MPALSDEILMAYADDVLDSEMRAHVEALLQRDPESLRRVEVYRATGTFLGQLYKAPALEPVPSHLVDFVLQYGEDGAASVKKDSFKAKLTTWGRKLVPKAAWDKLMHQAVWEKFSQPVTWQLAAASAAALIIGASAGWMLHGSSEDGSAYDLAVFKNGQIFANGTLRTVLETLPSGQEARTPGGAQDASVVRASLTFKDKAGSFCREYEIAAAGSKQYAGLACREGQGKWALQVHVAEAPVTPGALPGPAGRDGLLDPVVDRMMDGIAFGKKEEEAALAQGWQ
ncbi:MAG: anti-sigma factor family protein [Rhodomicrobium sp.]